MLRVRTHLPSALAKGAPFDALTLAHDERRLRRKLLTLPKGEEVLLDFPEPLTLADGDMLELEDGRLVAIRAAEEEVYEIRGRDAVHVARLAWHLGNRHLPAQIEKNRILIRRDRVIRDMLIGLGAAVGERIERFSPEHGAYSHDHGSDAHALRAR